MSRRIDQSAALCARTVLEAAQLDARQDARVCESKVYRRHQDGLQGADAPRVHDAGLPQVAAKGCAQKAIEEGCSYLRAEPCACSLECVMQDYPKSLPKDVRKSLLEKGVHI